MSDSNRVRIAYVEEASASQGTTPAITQDGTPQSNFRTARIKGETLEFQIANTTSDELRSDRMVADLIQTGAKDAGDLSWELSFPAKRSFFDQFLGAALFSDWIDMPERYNVAADSTISDVTTTTYTVASGAAYATGHLVRATGFTNSGNNLLFRAASGSTTTVVTTGLTTEAAPPAGARLKAVGFEGAASDITATGSGLASTTLDFTTLGLSVGQWIKIGVAADATKSFATAVLNDFVRVTAVAAHALTLDNLPIGWTTDNGSGKTIRVWTADILRNGTTPRFFSIEKAFLDLATPEYSLYRGMMVGQAAINLEANKILDGNFTFLGLDELGPVPTSSLGTPVTATTADVLNAVANVGRFAENGAVFPPSGEKNFIRSVKLAINNNLREQAAVGKLGLSGVGSGRFDLTGDIETYFGKSTLYNKFLAGQSTSINLRVNKNSQALVFTIPNLKFDKGRKTAGGANQDVIVSLGYRALRDPATACALQLDRFEEYA